MTDHPLRPATEEELRFALSFALRFDGRKAASDARELMANITAQRLVEHLERSGFVVMKKPPAAPHSAPAGPHGRKFETD
jgi:hypothetical protein